MQFCGFSVTLSAMEVLGFSSCTVFSFFLFFLRTQEYKILKLSVVIRSSSGAGGGGVGRQGLVVKVAENNSADRM